MELPRDNINRSRAAHPSRRGLAAAEAAESSLNAIRITQYETRTTGDEYFDYPHSHPVGVVKTS
ncbi:MAG TPA: hypothetical protein HPP87_11580 [Planctomycetes bacterium]|nr:hypothetical protein [Planctomycetota bacterium]